MLPGSGKDSQGAKTPSLRVWFRGLRPVGSSLRIASLIRSTMDARCPRAARRGMSVPRAASVNAAEIAHFVMTQLARAWSSQDSAALSGLRSPNLTSGRRHAVVTSDDRVIFPLSVSDDSSLRLRGRSINGNEGDAPADGSRKTDQGVARGVAESTLDAGDLRLLNGSPCRELTLREGCCGAHGGEVAAERYLCVDLCG